ncbi:hypothetical protein Anapl_06699 [Anas platyrhynchos]|uniref:Uncharacterized protein n=1 Tax=Anas platyrhynchos TaxID=8839 RepID=R0KAA3_ANAPL|nr:hypothetical protein Anapl_06699 [Anas platyrhynchos]
MTISWSCTSTELFYYIQTAYDDVLSKIRESHPEMAVSDTAGKNENVSSGYLEKPCPAAPARTLATLPTRWYIVSASRDGEPQDLHLRHFDTKTKQPAMRGQGKIQHENKHRAAFLSRSSTQPFLSLAAAYPSLQQLGLQKPARAPEDFIGLLSGHFFLRKGDHTKAVNNPLCAQICWTRGLEADKNAPADKQHIRAPLLKDTEVVSEKRDQGLSSLDVNAPDVLACTCGNGCKQVACGELLVTKGLQRLWDHVASGLTLLRGGSLQDGLVQVTAVEQPYPSRAVRDLLRIDGPWSNLLTLLQFLCAVCIADLQVKLLSSLTSKNGKYWILVSSKKSQRNWLRPKSEDFSGQTSAPRWGYGRDLRATEPPLAASWDAFVVLIGEVAPGRSSCCLVLPA